MQLSVSRAGSAARLCPAEEEVHGLAALGARGGRGGAGPSRARREASGRAHSFGVQYKGVERVTFVTFVVSTAVAGCRIGCSIIDGI